MSGPDEAQFTLPDLRSIRPEIGNIYRGLVPNFGQSRLHTPAWYSNWLIDEGWAEVHLADGRRSRAEVGDWLLCPPGIARYQIFPEAARILSVSFTMPLPPSLEVSRNLPRVLSPDEGAGLRRAGLELVTQAGSPATEDGRISMVPIDLPAWFAMQAALATFVGIWFDLVGGAGATARRIDVRIQDARLLLAAAPRMGPVPYAALTRRTGLGRVQLDRLFKAELGHSPKEELDRRCLDRVVRRLADPARGIKGIAAELGFSDSSHLCRWFAQRLGTSPERYRRSVAV